MPQPYELWWSVVPGPSQLVEQLTAHLVRFESALIPYTTASFPWGEEFRLSAYDRVRQVHPNLTEELCDASTMGERSPGRWVLDVVGRGEVFCLPSDDPIEIAAESGLLKQRIFWVTHFLRLKSKIILSLYRLYKDTTLCTADKVLPLPNNPT